MQVRITKIASFFAQLKGVRSIPLAAALTRGLVSFTARAHRTPLFVSLVEASRTSITLQVTDVLARHAANANVVVRSVNAAGAAGAAEALLSDADAKPSATTPTNTKYSVSFGSTTPACGRYTARVDAKATAGSDTISVSDATLLFNVLCRLEVRDTKLEAITATGTDASTVKHPAKLANSIALGFKQTLRVSFAVRDKAQVRNFSSSCWLQTKQIFVHDLDRLGIARRCRCAGDGSTVAR